MYRTTAKLQQSASFISVFEKDAYCDSVTCRLGVHTTEVLVMLLSAQASDVVRQHCTAPRFGKRLNVKGDMYVACLRE